MQEPIETIHVYIVKEDEGTKPFVDSTASNLTATTEQPTPLVQNPQRSHIWLVPLSIIAVNMSIALAVFFIHIYPLLTQAATITIIPKRADFTTSLTLSNIQSRIFSPMTLTQSKTVPATGKGHQPATQAHGEVTFYNALPQEQTIMAGTLLTASNGELFLTDSDVTIPAGTYTVNGQASVSATAQNYGTEGNIAAGVIHGLCCRAGILVLSKAFYGGQYARDYTMVRQEDIHRVVSSVLPTLTQHIYTAFQQQIQRGELLTPHQCSQKISTDKNVGDEASNVTVTVSETCSAAAYTSSDFQTKVQQALAQQAGQTIGKGFILASYALTSPLRTDIQHGKLILSAIYQGTVIYHFSSQDLTNLRHQLAGKTKQQAVAILSHLNGVDHISVQLGKNDKFPVDAANIKFLFVVENTS